MTHRGPRCGYFLVEALIAVSILGTAVVTMVTSLQSGMTLAQSSKNQIQALTLAEATLEELRSRWVQNPAFLDQTGNWVLLSPTTLPPNPDDQILQVRYRSCRHTNWTAVSGDTVTWDPAPGIPAADLFVCQVEAVPLNQLQSIEGATLTTLLARKGP